MPLLALALLLAAVPARAADKSSATVALEQLLELEQGTQVPSKREAWEKTYVEKADALVTPLLEHMASLGIKKEPVPEDWLSSWGRGFTWYDALAWTNALSKADDATKCELVTAAYLFGVWQVTTTPPEKPILVQEDMLVRKYTDLGRLWRDRARAAWAFRYIQHAHPFYVPHACLKYKLDGDKRWDFINDEDHYPLGFARPMCGRPMNSHFLDQDVEDKKRPQPKGWFTQRD